MIEVDELRSYHLEQAVRYQTELGYADPTLIKRAGDQLAVAGRRALWRSDWRAATNLLERALTLTGPTELSVALEVDLANAYALQEGEKAVVMAEAPAERAHASGEVAGEIRGRGQIKGTRTGADIVSKTTSPPT